MRFDDILILMLVTPAKITKSLVKNEIIEFDFGNPAVFKDK